MLIIEGLLWAAAVINLDIEERKIVDCLWSFQISCRTIFFFALPSFCQHVKESKELSRSLWSSDGL